MADRVTGTRAVRRGHPGRVAAAVGAAVLAVALLSSVAALGAATNGYRLAGIVAVGHDYLGFLEMPDGTQMLVRQGSVIASGVRVLLLDAQRLRIGLPDGVIELVLEGSGKPAATAVAAVRATPAASAEVRPAPDQDHLIFRKADPSRLSDAMGPAANADDRRTHASIETARRLAPILDLPPNSTVVAVNDRPVTSADAAIALIERRLASNLVATLNLGSSNGGPATRVYVSRAEH